MIRTERGPREVSALGDSDDHQTSPWISCIGDSGFDGELQGNLRISEMEGRLNKNSGVVSTSCCSHLFKVSLALRLSECDPILMARLDVIALRQLVCMCRHNTSYGWRW